MARLGRSFPFRPLVKRPDLGRVYYDNASFSPYEAALSTYNWTHVIGTNINRSLFVGVSIFAAGSVTGVDVSGQAMTFVRSDTNGIYRSEIWKLVNPTSGSRTITVTLNASLTSIAGAVSYWNTDQTNPVDAHNGANGTNTPASGSVTTTQQNDRVFGNLSAASASGITDQIGQAKRYINQGAIGTGAGAEKGTILTGASTTLQWNGLGVADSWAVSLVAIQVAGIIVTLTVFDTVTITESLTDQEQVNPVVFDTVTITEVVTIRPQVNLVVFDTVTLTEAVTMQKISQQTVFDTVTVTEAITIFITAWVPSVFDTVTITEAVTMGLVSQQTVVDTVTVSEAVTFQLVSIINVFDTITVTEAFSSFVVTSNIVADTITVTESVTLLLISQQTIVDTVTVTEVVALQVVSYLNVFDTVTLTEAVTMQLVSQQTVFDTVTVTENVTVRLISQQSLGDNITVTEVVTVQLLSYLSVFDTVTITEGFASIEVSSVGGLFDTVTISESVSLVFVYVFLSAVDTITVSEFVALEVILQINVNDPITVSESFNTDLFTNTYEIYPPEGVLSDDFGLSFAGSTQDDSVYTYGGQDQEDSIYQYGGSV